MKEKWKVLPCPVNNGYHEYHDYRYIATEGTCVDYDGSTNSDWGVSGGKLICMMRDGNVAEAQRIAKLPELEQRLEELTLKNKQLENKLKVMEEYLVEVKQSLRPTP